jgi:L-fucose isomerase-like protein
MNRREFMGVATAGLATGVLGLGSSSRAADEGQEWDPEKPLIVKGRVLTVQPVLMYRIAERKDATSWKSWGSVQSDAAASEEADRIQKELTAVCAKSDFPLDVRPIVKVKTAEEALQAHRSEYDVVIVYAAAGSGELLKACFAPQKNRDTIIFVRRQSGPTYYWYEALSVKYLQTSETASPRTDYRDHGGVHIHDVVVDDYDELMWRLRALYAIKNFIGARIVALGGAWGKYSPEAPQVAREKYGINIIEVSYDAVTQHVQSARSSREQVSTAQKWAEKYLSLPNTVLMTDKKYVVNAFLLYSIFKDLLREHDAQAFTIRGCMTTMLPIAQTTPCLALSLLNDEGMLAFCESDFVAIPSGILLRHISGKPVFLHNSTFPHKAMVTCAHCSAPRRMDGSGYEPAKIMTHYESEFGAAPKVEIPVGRQVTFIDPEYSTGRWLGFKGIVKGNPSYDICRSQQDVEIQGDWRKLLKEVRDSHWVMTYGDYLKEIGYASRKIGVEWVSIDQT